MNEEKIIIFAVVILLIFALVVWVLIDMIVSKKRIINNQKTIISHQIADMKQMIAELEGWERCFVLMSENKKDEVLAVLEEKIALAEMQSRHWEAARIKELKKKFSAKNSYLSN